VAGLILNLRPWETFLVGEHVLQNGPKKTQLRVPDEGAKVLRQSDALHPDQVRTPVTRAYYTAQLLVLGLTEEGPGKEALCHLLRQLKAALDERTEAAAALALALEGKYYLVLRQLRKLLPEEALLLSAQHHQEEQLARAC
jgi:flagellar protein FlbT